MLNPKQRAYLKSLAHPLKACFQIGKDGLSENLRTDVLHYLNKHELIKISILKNCALNIKEAALDIASLTNSELIQIIGRNIVFYRKSKKQLIKL